MPKVALLVAAPPLAAHAQNWVASWTGSAQGPYPIGNATAQPVLTFALPSADAGATDQTFRLIVRPDVWGGEARIRLSNVCGDKPVTFDGIYLGMQSSGAMLVHGTNRGVTFGGRSSVTIPPGKMAVSDPVALPWVSNPTDPFLANRKLAISFHIAGARAAA